MIGSFHQRKSLCYSIITGSSNIIMMQLDKLKMPFPMTPPLTILIFAQVTNHSRLFQYLKYTSNHDVVSDWQLSVYRANDFSRQPAHLPQINSTSPYYKPITPLYESSEQGADRKNIEYASHKGFNNPRTVLPQIKNRSVNTHATHADYDDFHYGSTQLR